MNSDSLNRYALLRGLVAAAGTEMYLAREVWNSLSPDEQADWLDSESRCPTMLDITLRACLAGSERILAEEGGAYGGDGSGA